MFRSKEIWLSLFDSVQLLYNRTQLYSNIYSNFLSIKLYLFSYQSVKRYVLGAQKNRLIETFFLSTHNICYDKNNSCQFHILIWRLGKDINPDPPNSFKIDVGTRLITYIHYSLWIMFWKTQDDYWNAGVELEIFLVNQIGSWIEFAVKLEYYPWPTQEIWILYAYIQFHIYCGISSWVTINIATTDLHITGNRLIRSAPSTCNYGNAELHSCIFGYPRNKFW